MRISTSPILYVRILLEAVYPRAYRSRVRLFMQRPSYSFLFTPLHCRVLSLSFQPIPHYARLFLFCLSLSVFFATYMPLYLLAPPSLSLSLLISHITLYPRCSFYPSRSYCVVALDSLSLSWNWILYLVLLVYQFIYIMIPVIFSVCVSFCKRLHLSFPLEDFTTCICSVCATYCHLLSRAFLFEISDDIESKI